MQKVLQKFENFRWERQISEKTLTRNHLRRLWKQLHQDKCSDYPKQLIFQGNMDL
jgi:hypothetical protein